MKPASLLTILHLTFIPALAQNLTGLPPCAVPCFESNYPNSACASSNITCLCSDKHYFQLVQDCVIAPKACDLSDALGKVSNFHFCLGVGKKKRGGKGTDGYRHACLGAENV